MPVIREFSNVTELIKSIDDTIAEYRKILGEYLRKVEELRVKAEQEAKLKALLGKLGITQQQAGNELDLRSVRVVINPSATQELSSIEAALENLNNKITQLLAIRKDLDTLAQLGDVNVKITVVYIEGIPKSILLKLL